MHRYFMNALTSVDKCIHLCNYLPNQDIQNIFITSEGSTMSRLAFMCQDSIVQRNNGPK